MKMSKRLAWLVICIVLLPVSVAAQGEAPTLLISGVWARATVAAPMAEATPEMGSGGHMGGMQEMGGVSAAYMLIENPGDQPLRLVTAATPAADLVEIHEVMMENEVMRMRPVEGGIEIPAGGSIQLQPGGYHVMLMELTRALVPGEAIPLTLAFEVLNADGSSSGETLDVLLGAPIMQEMPEAGTFVVANAWARPTVATDAVAPEATPEMSMGTMEATPEMGMGGHMAGSGGVSAAYMLVTNRGETADRLVGAVTNAASLVEVHEVTMENEVMRMRPIDGGIEIPAGGTVELRPGGYHIMLMELQREMVPGEAIALTLLFESGAELVIGVPVQDMTMVNG